VHLMGVYLINVHLTGVYLIGVYLMGVYLMSVHLIGMYIMGAYCIRLRGTRLYTRYTPVNIRCTSTRYTLLWVYI
jgi:hypothetical protein